MSEFKLNILGCGSATPSFRHLPSCQAIEYRQRIMLIDCGEGAQLSLRRAHLKFNAITDVFISHLHGDHLLGLPGLLSTMSLNDKNGRVRIHIFEKGAEMLRQIMSVICHDTSFEIEYNIIKPEGGVLIDDKGLTVTAFPLYHRVPCVGFRFDEKPKLRHIKGDMVKFFKVPVKQMASIKEGSDFVTEDGRVIANERLTDPPTPSVSYAYCSDTMFSRAVAKSVEGVDVLYHEATYLSDLKDQARERGHSTAAEAAEIARLADAKQLIIGHYSKRYIGETPLLNEAKTIFSNTIAANEGMQIDLS